MNIHISAILTLVLATMHCTSGFILPESGQSALYLPLSAGVALFAGSIVDVVDTGNALGEKRGVERPRSPTPAIIGKDPGEDK